MGIKQCGINEKYATDRKHEIPQRMGSVHYLTLTGNYALSASKLRYLLEQDTMFGCGIGYGLDSMFGPLEASLNYANRANKVSMYVNLGFKF